MKKTSVIKTSVIMLGLSATVLAACSQPPAPIAHKGDRFYGKDNTITVAQAKKEAKYKGFISLDEPAVQAASAPVQSIQVAQLSAPKPIVVKAMPALVPQPSQRVEYKVPAPVVAATNPAFIDVEAPRQEVAVANPAPVVAPPVEQLAPLPIEQIVVTPPATPVQQAIKETYKQPELSTAASTFIWPVEGKVVSRFGPKSNGLINDGINIEAAEGEPIWSAASGEVVYAGNELKGYGNMMILRHNNGWMTAYAHASDMLVNKGDRVKQGDLIGYVGKTGAVNTAQLHFGIREGKKPVNPETLLPRRLASAK